MKEQILAFVSSSKFSAPIMTLNSTGMQKQGLEVRSRPQKYDACEQKKG